jgi:glutamate dehydrogenase/leucine dehydrogenase
MNVKQARIGVLGFGGLGQAAACVLAPKSEMILVAAADKAGFAYANDGLAAKECIKNYQSHGSVGYFEPFGTQY